MLWLWCRPGGGRALGGDGASGMHARGKPTTEGLLVLKTGAGGAHLKHAVHACDLGCIKFHGLVERHRMLPKGTNDAGRGAGQGQAGGRGGVAVQAARTAGPD